MIKIEFCGHSCFRISTESNELIIDPFLTGNPQAVLKPEDVNVDTVLLTHGHGDHIADAEVIAKNNDALIIACYELAKYFENKNCKTHGMGVGGGYNFDFGYMKLTHAQHGSAVMEGEIPYYTGNPCGIILKLEDKTIYHAGDTGLFGDMKMLGDRNDIDVAMLPIGDNFTMGIDDAVYAAELLNPKIVIPMHYNTFPVIEVDVEKFKKGISELGIDCKIMKASDTFEI